jgi:hypothetical protein
VNVRARLAGRCVDHARCDEIWFAVRDDGAEFDAARAPTGMGFDTLRDRGGSARRKGRVIAEPGRGTIVRGLVIIVGTGLEVRSAPGTGTSVISGVPVDSSGR